MHTQKIFDLKEINILAKNLAKELMQDKILLLSGDLGAGKTTLTKEICRALSVKDKVSSPSFNLLNIYNSEHGEIYHYDLYRLNNKEEIHNLDLDHALDNAITIIEWPEIITDILPKNSPHLNIKIIDQNKREYNQTRL